jgi:hypothetical protein
MGWRERERCAPRPILIQLIAASHGQG